ncbi:MAG: DUF4292 domain-containing protein [Bacteroidota bacterium]
MISIAQRLFFSTLLLGLFLGLSCNTAKKTTEVVVVEENTTMDAKGHLDALIRQQIQADWMDASARISFDDGSMSVGGTASIKMKKDEAVLMSVKKFGFEVARAYITEDSLFILDRINGEYAAEPLSYLEERFKLPADLTMLQQLLLGNPVFLTTANPDVNTEGAQLSWSAENDNQSNTYTFTMPDYQLGSMAIREGGQARKLDVQLAKYADAGANRDFSYLRTFQIDSKETGSAQIELEFTKVEINVPTTINFSIPPRYQRSQR